MQGYDKNEWCTPALYVEKVRNVLGVIDLDPTSTDAAQSTVQAVKYYTKNNSCLKHDWHGNVYMNPPYSPCDGLTISTFVDKFVHEYRENRISGIVLTNNDTDRTWWVALWSNCSLFCNTIGRIRFVHPERTADSPRQGQTFFLFGTQYMSNFYKEFKDIATVSVPWR